MSRHVTRMTIEDAGHFTADQRVQIIASYPAHERDARTRGIPALGSGRVFAVADEDIVVEPFEIPRAWPQIVGLDFGWDHPAAAVSLAWDREADCLYVCKEYAAREAIPVVHAAAIKPWGAWLPCAWPRDGLQHDKGSGETLAAQYRAQGLNLLAAPASFPDGGVGVEAGVFEMLERMQTGRWKVFRTCVGWLGEFRLYHRDKGLIVKIKDDRLSASRYAMMMAREAITEPGPTAALKRNIRGLV